MKNRPLWAIVGFLMFTLGILSLILSLVGLRFTFFSFYTGSGIGYILFVLILLFGGIVLLYVARTGGEELE
jgi:O-antigen ligase